MGSDVDVIVAWPRNCDYPTWRWFIAKHRDYFQKVIVMFTEADGNDYREFIKRAMKDLRISFYDSAVIGNQDWRNVAVNGALHISKANWIWFTEQDLFITHQAFWTMIARYMTEYDVIGYQDGATRLHPSNLFVKRHFIDKTSKDFSVIKDRLDHFAKFYTEMRLAGANVARLKNDEKYFYHMNGLSHNWNLLSSGAEITYKPKEFLDYLNLCLTLEDLDPRWKSIAERGVLELERLY